MSPYLRFEDALRHQDVHGIGRTLLGVELAGALLFLVFADLSLYWDRLLLLILGATVVLAGLVLIERNRFWSRVLVSLGGFPVVLLVGWYLPFLGVIVGIIYLIGVGISFVA